jgi:hypothetical protein
MTDEKPHYDRGVQLRVAETEQRLAEEVLAELRQDGATAAQLATAERLVREATERVQSLRAGR